MNTRILTKFSFLTILLLMVTLHQLAAQSCSISTSVNGNAGTGTASSNIGQSFTACGNARLSTVKVGSSNTGTALGYIRIYLGEGTSGTYLGQSGNIALAYNRTNTWDVNSLNINLVAGQKFTVMFYSASTGATPLPAFQYSTSTRYGYYSGGRSINYGSAINDMFAWVTTTGLNPTLTPTHSSTEVNRATDLTMKFARDVIAVSGDVTLKNIDLTTSVVFDASELVIDGTLVTIPNTVVLEPSTNYEIIVPSSVLTSTDGIIYRGKATGEWTFTTSDKVVSELTNALGTVTNVNPIPYTMEFSEVVTGFESSDLTVTNGTASNFAGTGTSYTVDITPTSEGIVKVEFDATATVEGNEVALDSIEYDVTLPTVVLSSDFSGTINNVPYTIDIAFSEDAVGFEISDLSATNGTILTLDTIDAANYQVTLTAVAEGAISLEVAADVATDAAGNGNTISNEYTVDYEIDLNDGLFSYYPFNNILWDVVDNNGEFGPYPTLPSLALDRFDQADGAYYFSDTTGQLNLTGFDISTIQNGYSVSTWINPNEDFDSGTTGQRYIYNHAGYSNLYFEDGKFKVLINNTEAYETNAILAGNDWHHLVLTIEDGGEVKLYINNNLFILGTSPATISTGSGTLDLGTNGTSGYLGAEIDEIRFYNKPLNALEVDALNSASEYLLESRSEIICDNTSFTTPEGEELTEAGNYSFIDPSQDSDPDTFVAFTLSLIDAPVVTAHIDNSLVCEGNMILIHGEGALTYTWDNGIEDSVAFVSTVTTTYNVTGTAENGCMNTAMILSKVTPRGYADEAITTADAGTCLDGSTGATISTASSEIGVNYYLRDSEDNSVVLGPEAGTGSAIDFTTGNLFGVNTYNVYAEREEVLVAGTALDFDGSNDELVTNYVVPLIDAFTIETWLNPRSTTYDRVMSNYGGGGVKAGHILLDTYDASANNGKAIRIYFGGAGDAAHAYSVPNVLTSNAWNHVAVTFNQGAIKIYVNAVEVGSSTASFTEIGGEGFPMHIGDDTNTGTINFDGQLDDVRFWHTARTAVEIKDNMNFELLGSETGLEAYYKFNEGTGLVAADVVNGNDGTLTNMDEATDWVSDAGLIADPSCGFQMTTEVTIGDGEAPTVVTQDLTLQLDLSGSLTITTTDVENGSTDNCTATGSLDFALDQDTFSCDDIGVNQVVLTVTDQVGNEGTGTANITITSSIEEYVLTATTTDICPGESVDFSLDGSQVGVNYALKNESGDILAGPIDGTDAALSFTVDALNESTEVSVHAGVIPEDSQHALDFDGVNDKASTTFISSATTELTIEGWIYPRATKATRIITNYSGTGTVGGDIIIDTYDAVRNGRGIRFYLGTATGAQVNYTVSNVLTLNAWNHIATTFDNGLITIFVDGVAVGTSTVALAALKPTTVPFHFAEDRGGSHSEYFNGQMDEFRIWNTARTASELLANKDIQFSGTETGLSAYFSFEDAAGTILTELVNGANGTLLNMDPATDWVVGPDMVIPSKCTVQMNATVNVQADDITDPIAIAQDISVQLGLFGTVSISADDVNDGSSDECTSLDNLILSLDQNTFDCADTGVQEVMLTVSDASGNEATALANVTVSSFIEDELVTVESAFVCDGDEAAITVASSKVGVNYTLRDAGDQVIDGPTSGTGSELIFSSGVVATETVFHVLAETEAGDGTSGLDFDGSNDHLTMSINDSFDYENGYTLESWVKVDLPVSNHNPIFSISNSTQSDIEVYIQLTTNRLVVVHNRGFDHINSNVFSLGLDNQWFHLGIVYDGSNAIQVFYDGVEQSSISSSGTPGTLTKNTGQSMAIGRVSNTAFGANGAYFKGQLDDFRIWTAPKDASELLADKDECLGGHETDLEYYFNFNEASGTTAADLVNGSNAILTNMDAASDWIDGAGQSCQSAVCSLILTDQVTIDVGDDTSPMVLTQAVSITLDIDGNASITAEDVNFGSSDNCSEVAALVLSLDQTAFTCAEVGENTVTLSVEDEVGNVGTGEVVVTVIDAADPIAIGKNITVELTADGSVMVSAADLNDGSSDLCTASNDLTFAITGGQYTCSELGEHLETLTVTDASGNESTAEVTITVVDNILPTITTMDITVDLDENGSAQITASQIDDGSVDNCTFSLAADILDFSCDDLGANTVVLSGTDASNNVASANAIVTVRDVMTPAVLVRDISVNLDNDGNATISATDIDNGSTDNCTAAESLMFSIDISSFTTNELGANNVTLTVEDANGNSATGIAIVTVEQKTSQTIDFTTLADVQYGSSGNIALIATASSGLSVGFSVVSGPAILTEDGLAVTGAGEVVVEASQAGDDTFAMVTERQTFTVTKAPLVVTATSLSVNYNEAIPALTFEYSGFIGKEGSANLTAEPTISTIATEGSDAGTYDILLVGGSADNYELTLVNAILTINKIDQILSIPTISGLEYDSDPFTINASTTSGLDLTYTYVSGPATLVGNLVTLTGTQGVIVIEISQLGNVNYNEVSVNASYTVTDPRLTDQTITFGALASRVYGDESFSLTATASSQLAVEFSVISGPASLSGQLITITGAGEVVIEASQAGNDSFNAADAVQQSFMVSKAELTVTADDQTINYSEETPALTISYSGFVNAEDESALDSAPTLSTGSVGILDAGTYVITLSGGVSTNYNITLVNGIVTVNKAMLTVTADDQTITFSDETPALTLSYSGFVNAEDESVLDSEPTLSIGLGVLDAGTYVITVSGGTATNYDFTLVNGTMTVNKAVAVITITDLLYQEDGSVKEVTVSTDPSQLSFTVTYDGIAAAPSIAGSYDVVVAIDELNYEGQQTAIMVIESIALAIDDLNEVKVSVYPNPVSEVLFIESPEAIVSSARVFNINGSLEREVLIEGYSGSLEVTNMADGMYILLITDQENRVISKTKIVLKN